MSTTRFKYGLMSRILAVIALVLSVSCSKDDLLDPEPTTFLTTDALDTEAEMINLVNGAYDPLQWQVINGPQTHMYPIMFQDIRADNCISQWATFWVAGIVFDDFTQIQPNNPSVQALWTKWYTVIQRANTAIHFVTGFEFTTPGLQDRLIAEAKFLRGFAYFELARHFGGGPLITQYIGSTDDQVIFPRATLSEQYAQITQDLLDAATNLPLKSEYAATDLGRATSGAAYTLLAKVHLYQEEYDLVNQYTEIVINSGEYALESSFRDNFNPATEHGVESIFEIGYADGYSNIPFESPAAPTNQGSSSYQMFGFIFQGTGTFGNAVPRQSFIDIYDLADTRLDATVIQPETFLEDLGMTAEEAGTPNYQFFWTNPDALESEASTRKYYVPFNTGSTLLNLGSSPLNEKVLRYADVLLMHAEAAVNGGGGDGQTSLNLIRQRAFNVADASQDIPLTMDNVKIERRRELATEGWDRFTDLVRWGDAPATLAFKGFQAGRDEVLPIPQSEIDLVGTSVLTQNPGY